MSRNMTTLKLVEAKAERELSDVAKTAKEIREALKKTFRA